MRGFGVTPLMHRHGCVFKATNRTASNKLLPKASLQVMQLILFIQALGTFSAAQLRPPYSNHFVGRANNAVTLYSDTVRILMKDGLSSMNVPLPGKSWSSASGHEMFMGYNMVFEVRSKNRLLLFLLHRDYAHPEELHANTQTVESATL